MTDLPLSSEANQEQESVSLLTPTNIVRLIWVVGVFVLVGFFSIIHVKSHRGLRFALSIRDNIFLNGWLAEHKLRRKIRIMQSEKTTSPLADGLLKPRIILPKSIDLCDEQLLHHVLMHEYYHISRFDALWKLLMVVTLCIHWFNPLAWVMFVLANRDLEITCDEMVVRHFGAQTKKAYAYSIIRMAEQRSKLTPFYNGFSKNAAVERINCIMKINKKSFFSIIITLVLVASTTLVAFAAPKISSTDLGSLSNISDKDTLMEAAETFVSLGVVKGKGTNKNGEVVIDFASKITQQEMIMLVARTSTGLPDYFETEEGLQQYTALSGDEVKQTLGITTDINPISLGAIVWCYENKIIPQETLNPENAVTIFDATAMMIKALGYIIPSDDIMPKAVEIDLYAGFTKGFADNSLHELTRGEAIMLLYNFFNSDRQLAGMWWNDEAQLFEAKSATEPMRARFEEYADERFDHETIIKKQPPFYFDGSKMVPGK